MVWWIRIFAGMHTLWVVDDIRLLGFLTSSAWSGPLSGCVVMGVRFGVFMVTYRPADLVALSHCAAVASGPAVVPL
jgi:hypothetical protein